MSVVMMFKCPKCEKMFEADNVYKETVVEKLEEGEVVREYPINYVMIGYYDYKTKQFLHKAYGKDMCPDCMRDISHLVLSGENTKIRIHDVKPKERPVKKKKDYTEHWNPKSELEKEQQEFAESRVTEDDGE